MIRLPDRWGLEIFFFKELKREGIGKRSLDLCNLYNFGIDFEIDGRVGGLYCN